MDIPNERSGSAVQRASDLQENPLVDREAAGLLALCEANGAKLGNCSASVNGSRDKGQTRILRSQRANQLKLIAIIDDDEAMQDSLRDLMEAAGLVARCFGSAEEFLESGLHRQAACLITDILMPKISGLQLQARLKNKECDIPLIFITAYGDAAMRIQAMEDGAVEFFAKPFDHYLLLKTVRAALDM